MKSLLERLAEYSAQDWYPFHMPGHKRRGIPADGDGIPFPDPYSVDITEISGFDDLHHAEGILRESMEKAAEIYGADRTYYLVNGSTGGILSAICGTVPCGGRILLARDSHMSAYNGVVLGRLKPEYVYPRERENPGMNGSIDPGDVREILEEDRRQNPETDRRIRAVFITSPTYEGIVSDIRSIAGIAHSYGIPLIVDEAHGAHLSFAGPGGFFPEPALSCGADIVIQSLHKTLPSFTQTAVLHMKGELVRPERVEQYLRMLQSSSPSYLLMAGIERCIRYMDGEGRAKMRRYEDRLKRFYKNTRGLKELYIPAPWESMVGPVFAVDPSKIIISTEKTEELDLDGGRLGAILRDKYRLEMELNTPGYVLAMTSPADTDEGFERLEKALFEIDGETAARRERYWTTEKQPGSAWSKACEERAGAHEGRPQAHGDRIRTAGDGNKVFRDGGTFRTSHRFTPAEALELPAEPVLLAEAAGRIVKEFVYTYPPGIPLLVPGETVTAEIAGRILKDRAAGMPLRGPADPEFSTILTVACGD